MFVRLGSVSYRIARRIVIGVIGGTVLLLGVVMLVAPGPGLLVIPLGLAILGIEFAWARLWLRKLKDKVGPDAVATVTRQYRRLWASFGTGSRAAAGARKRPEEKI